MQAPPVRNHRIEQVQVICYTNLMGALATFGQELYPQESIRAIECFSDLPVPTIRDARSRGTDDQLLSKIAELLPHPSESTRLRVASKLIQRFFKGSPAYPRLVKALKCDAERRQLLYWRAARTDAVIAAIAEEVFYPYFVLNALPKGYNESSFRMANTATLFSVDKVISRDFAVRYAREAWGFDSERTVTLALRIMKQADILDSISVKLGRRHVLGYFPQPHSLRPEVFAYCMYEEFLGDPPSPDRIQNGDCSKLFFLNRLQVDSLLKTLDKRKLIEFEGMHVRFAHSDLDSLVMQLTK